MKITDVNCMIGHFPLGHRSFPEESLLLRAMDDYRITNSVVFHSCALWDTQRGNQQMRDIALTSADRIQSCYVLAPNFDSAQFPSAEVVLNQLRADRPAAIKLFPNNHHYHFDSFYSGELLDMLNELAMPVLFDVDQKPSFEELPKLARDYPDIKFLLLRHPPQDYRYARQLLKKTGNVFFDTSITIEGGVIDELVGKYGSERFVFGSGMPFYMPAGALGLILYARISDQDKENILNSNWTRISGGTAWK